MKHGPQSPDCYRFKNALFHQGIITMILSHCKIINIEKKKKKKLYRVFVGSLQAKFEAKAIYSYRYDVCQSMAKIFVSLILNEI